MNKNSGNLMLEYDFCDIADNFQIYPLRQSDLYNFLKAIYATNIIIYFDCFLRFSTIYNLRS